MTEKDKALVLGGTFPHITLIKKLKKRGYYVILIDYYKDPPARLEADCHIQESTLDKETVLKIAKDFNAKLVISTCIDQANVTACYISEHLGLPKPYSYSTSLEVTNKLVMKKKMIDNKIPTSKFQKVKSIEDFNINEMNLPFIVKPVDSNSSKGVKKIKNKEKIIEYLNLSLSVSRDGNAIIEEFKEGKEIGIDCFVTNGVAHILMIKERRKIPLQDDDTQQIFGCFWPDNINKDKFSIIEKIVNDIARVFKLDNTPLMIQAIINKDDINVIEFAPRIGGGESFRIIKLSSGFDIMEAAIDSFLNKKVKVNIEKPKEYFAENFIYTKKSIFKSIKGYEKLINDGTIEYVDFFKTKGMEIGNELSSNNRVGVFTVKGKNKEEIFNKIELAVHQIEVYDINNKPIMRKDIYTNLKLN